MSSEFERDPIFLLGHIKGIVDGLPARLDRIEETATRYTEGTERRFEQVDVEITDIKKRQGYMSGIYAGFNGTVCAVLGGLVYWFFNKNGIPPGAH